MNSKVTIYKVDDYDVSELKYIIKDSLKSFDLKGKKVLLKPNMLQAHTPDECVTTHPAVVEAAVLALTEKGADCAVGDSPSGYGLSNAKEAAETTGFAEVCRKTGVEFDYFEEQALKKVDIPDGKVYKKVYLPESYFTYDFVLNLPKLKTHSLTIFTLGVKNMLGVIPGLGKVDFHNKAAHPVKFASAICDLYSAVKPDFTILDGIKGMEGTGPVNGNLKKMNRVFTGDDAVSLDAAVEKICGIDPEKVPLTKEAFKRGLGKIDNFDIIKKYTGEDTEFSDFKTSLLTFFGSKLPVWLLDFLPRIHLHRPKVVKENCIKCRKCSQVCPADAIDFNDEGYPTFDMDKCIKCFCCAERCPERTIFEKTNFIAKLFM